MNAHTAAHPGTGPPPVLRRTGSVVAVLLITLGLLWLAPPASAAPSDNYFPFADRDRESADCTDNFALGTHDGTDCFADVGHTMIAVEAGTIEYVNYGEGYDCATWSGDKSGNNLSLTGDSGTRYYYGHMDSIAVVPGQRVDKGEIIGTNGETGNAACSAPHLHMQISYVNDRTPVNPYPLMANWSAFTPGGTPPPPPPPPGGDTPNPDLPWVRPGDSGPAVECVQDGVAVVTGQTVVVDGNYGPQTTQAVENFQGWFGLYVDGQVGPSTGGTLADAYDDAVGAGAWAANGCYAHVPAS